MNKNVTGRKTYGLDFFILEIRGFVFILMGQNYAIWERLYQAVDCNSVS